MVIDNFDLVGVSVPPNETYPPLVVDPDRVLAGPGSLKLLQPVAGDSPQLAEGDGGVNYRQFPQCAAPQIPRKPPGGPPAEESLRIPRGEALDHRTKCNDNRYTRQSLPGEGRWDHPYSPRQAFFPLKGILEDKDWPPVSRIDNVAGDRNLVCSCPPMEDYAEAAE